MASAAILGAVMFVVVVRPRRVHSWMVASAAGALVVLAGLTPPAAVLEAAVRLGPTLLFLAGLLVVSAIADAAGVFQTIAAWVLVRASNGGNLLLAVYGVGAALTLLCNLDVTAVTLTPVVAALVVRTRLPPAPFIATVVLAANAPSLALPVSNLTNAIVYERGALAMADFIRLLGPAQVVVVAGGAAAVFLRWGRGLRRIPVQLSAEDVAAAGGYHLGTARAWRFEAAAATVLAATLTLVLVASALGQSLWPGAVLGATAAGWVAVRWGGHRPVEIGRAIPLGLFPYVLGLAVVVAAIPTGPLGEWAAAAVSANNHLAIAGLAALAANAANNLPAAIWLANLLPADAPPAAWAAMLVGANVGPLLTPWGSLATLLIADLAGRRGAPLSRRAFLTGVVPIGLVLWLAAAVTLGLVAQ
ncbi:MAG: hypothetical protein HY331_10885 [Chloroflexi bacterium]|nr:hypothetical protein [Chloroflexota bacterium]